MTDAASVRDKIDQVVKENKCVLFMKGNRDAPRCGFSGAVIQVLNHYNAKYETVDVLLDDTVREAIKEYSKWPTIPQLFVEGEFVGGCDIVIGMHNDGELAEVLKPVIDEAVSAE
eukprot:CAMPEP_0174243332 /NCGR_PEP_ID=MMETSP0417-20130205/31346_1 /TAXON_ID=242541 /ORGANISM="Mayorella sp, Strain BSH-02190019" /LENGTH=114 /DNA_ID=CAMNT_0015322835 /DNA_START=132 /DNA_END=476 /DNA_ORIENTATION=+